MYAKKEREQERKKDGELVSIKQLDLLKVLVKPSGPNQKHWGGEGGTNRVDLVPEVSY